MATNKVILNDETLIDLTQDTVTEEDVAQGVTFHLPSGAQGTGSMIKRDGAPLVTIVADDGMDNQYFAHVNAAVPVPTVTITAEDVTE